MIKKEARGPAPTGDLHAALRTWGQVFTHRVLSNTIAYCRKHGLSMPQVGTLHHLLSSGSSTVSVIGDHLGVTSAAVSQMLERLVQQGYVQRHEDPDDRRARRISLTPKGAAVLRGSLEAGRAWMDGLAEAVEPADRLAVTRVLESLSALVARLPRL